MDRLILHLLWIRCTKPSKVEGLSMFQRRQIQKVVMYGHSLFKIVKLCTLMYNPWIPMENTWDSDDHCHLHLIHKNETLNKFNHFQNFQNAWVFGAFPPI